MIKFNKQKETTLNFNSIRVLNHIDTALKEEFKSGWIQEIKFINSKERIAPDNQEFHEVSKVFLTYNKSIYVNNKIIGHIEYDYQINSHEREGLDDFITCPSFKEFILLEKRQEFYEDFIERLNEKLNDNN